MDIGTSFQPRHLARFEVEHIHGMHQPAALPSKHQLSWYLACFDHWLSGSVWLVNKHTKMDHLQ
ncbi:hypothetical protein LINPERPRIM_LOCUS3826, partial [Linum perenne]